MHLRAEMYSFWLILTTVIWGSTFFIVKDTVEDVNEYYLVFIRNILAAIPMLVFSFIKDRENIFSKKAILQGMLMGFLLSSTYISQTIGLKFTSSGHSAFITGSAVVFVPFVLFFFFRQTLKLNNLISIFVVFAGLFMLTYDFDTSINKGDLFTLITVASYTLHIVLAGKFVQKTPFLPLISYQFLFASIFCLPGMLLSDFSPGNIQLESVTALVYLGLVGTLFCYFVSVWAQKYVSSIKVALIFALEPVFAAIFAYFADGETLSAKEILGALLIIAGVILYNKLENLKNKLVVEKAE